MRRALTNAALGGYRWVALSGVLDRPRARRAFEAAYLGYKQLIEAGPVGHLRSHVEPGSVVIDVGANIGFFATRFGQWVGPSGHVYAIEPEARNAASLRARVAREGLSDVVECLRAAATEHSGTVHLVLNPIHPGDHHLGAEGEPVRAVTLDELTADDQRPVSFVKIDVQGAELDVLAGATRVLAEHRPAIFIEVDDASLRRFGSSPAELIGTLAAQGYSGHLLERDGVSAPLSPDALVERTRSAYIDVLFLPVPVKAGTPAGRR